MEFNKEYVLDLGKKVLEIDSPTGYCKNAVDFVQKECEALGYSFSRTKKGNGIISVTGHSSEKTIGLSVHVDTLGLMVRSISGDGTIKTVPLGGVMYPTYDSEYCKIQTRDGKIYTGTILSDKPSVHVYKGAREDVRTADSMHVRIDEVVKNKEDVTKLGISAGDFIFVDPKTTITESDYVKSRFLDDKISVAILFGLLKRWKDNNEKPKFNVEIFISTYEEVGHGLSHMPKELDELIAVDMGCIGEDLNCTEHTVSICAKDSSSPYDYDLTTTLINLAKANEINYVVDIYPMYSSDATASLHAGHDFKAALIGTGVHASHGLERTHYDGILNTMKLLYVYLT